MLVHIHIQRTIRIGPSNPNTAEILMRSPYVCHLIVSLKYDDNLRSFYKPHQTG